MGILDWFRRKRRKRPSKIGVFKIGVFEDGVGLGLARDDPIRIRIANWGRAREFSAEKVLHEEPVLDALGEDAATAGADTADTVVGHMLGELAKMTFLRNLFGEEGVKWTCGNRAYYEGSVQSQEIRFAGGRVLTLWFDFSGCDPPPGP